MADFSYQSARPAPRRRLLERKQLLLEYLPMVLTAALIVFFAVLRRQSFLKTLPTLITLIVQILMAHANRFGFLLGGFNAALYGVGYLSEGLYFSAGSAILFSFPMQIWSFFHWRKNTAGKTVRFRTFRPWQWILMLVGMGAGWCVCQFFFRPLFSDAVYPALDSYLFISGIAATVLMAVPYLESQYLNLVSGILSLVLRGALSLKNPADLTYFMISLYNLYRTVQALVIWTKQYRMHAKDESAAI